MLRRTARFGATLTLLTIPAMSGLFGGCGDNVTVAETPESGPPVFVDPDAEPALPDANELVQYCPSNQCPAGRTTCPDSHFLCDVDLRTDRSNCGACGFACPAPTLFESYECDQGRCILHCARDNHLLNCDGLPDNGCETSELDSNNCGMCGNKCTDPDKPCVMRTDRGNIGCGCLEGKLYCPNSFPPCIDPTIDDNNCGKCDNRCDPTGDGGVTFLNTYYGCLKSECDNLKCAPYYGDCDNDLAKNGCEMSLFDRNNCGACGNRCADGQECRMSIDGVPECMCPGNQTFCPISCNDGVCFGRCVDLATDREHCGTCNYDCRGDITPFSVGTCTFGTCNRKCNQGRADCNGNMEDDCEINTNSDPQNCGGCGIVCDAIAGQACVGGSCVVEPCAEDGGGIPAR